MIRLILSADFDTDDLGAAYRALVALMLNHTGPLAAGWESSQEWYRDLDNEPGDPDELQAATEEEPRP